MNNKKVLISLAIVTSLVLPFSVFAATSNSNVAKNIRSFLRIDTSKLTDIQKADVTVYEKKMADLQKEFINQMVANGSITKEEGDAEIARIDEGLKSGGLGRGLPGFDRKGQGREGKMPNMFNFLKLTDVQKADLKDGYVKILNLQKEHVSKMVSSGLLTKVQGDTTIKNIDNVITNIETNDLSKIAMLCIRDLGDSNIIGISRINSSKLTDAQKADLETFNKQMTALQKELISKMVSNGTITKEQGDTIISRLDNKGQFRGEFKGGNKLMNGKGNGPRKDFNKMKNTVTPNL